MPTRRPLFNLPNVMTLSRFFLAPVMLALILHLPAPEDDPGAWTTSLAMVVVLGVTLLTDLLDGMTARARDEVTNFGKIMDPVADSTFFMTLMFGLAACPRFGDSVSLWFPILILYREIAIQIFRRYAALKGSAVPAKMAGKIKMFSQSVLTAVFFLFVFARDWMVGGNVDPGWLTEEILHSFAFYLALLTVAFNVWSLLEYSRDVPDLIAEYISQDGE